MIFEAPQQKCHFLESLLLLLKTKLLFVILEQFFAMLIDLLTNKINFLLKFRQFTQFMRMAPWKSKNIIISKILKWEMSKLEN